MDSVLILYMELAGYTVNSINKLVEEHDLLVHVVAYPVNAEAPFEFDFHPSVTLHKRKDHSFESLNKLANTIKPKLIFSGGWSDKVYLEIVSKHKDVPSVLIFDNQWEGSVRQYMAMAYARVKLVTRFDYVFIPGEPQRRFAKNMGFKDEAIKTGYYTCELEKFNGFYERSNAEKFEQMPKRLLYVGRYIPQKGIFDLFETFSELTEEGFADWELHCLGTGDLWDQRLIHPNIVHHGFVQPKDFESHIANTSIFVLPSHFEPWGVVAQEMAASGYPMVLSDKIGAASAFLEDGQNGASYESGNKPALKAALKQMMSIDQTTFATMAKKSHALAQKISPSLWAQTMVDMMAK